MALKRTIQKQNGVVDWNLKRAGNVMMESAAVSVKHSIVDEHGRRDGRKILETVMSEQFMTVLKVTGKGSRIRASKHTIV